MVKKSKLEPINDDNYIKLLQREFREKRTYGDKEDFEGIDIKKSKSGKHCRLLINEYYSYSGYIYKNNAEAENDPNNYIEVSLESVENLIRTFITRRVMIAPWMKMPMYRVKLDLPPKLLNVMPLDLSSYYEAIYERKDEIYRRNPYFRDAKELTELATERNNILIRMRETQKSLWEQYFVVYNKLIEKTNEIIIKHLETHIGKIEKTLYIEDKENFPFFLHQIPASDNRDFGVIATCGYSIMNMQVPKEFKLLFEHIEFLFIIPPDFPFPLENDPSHEYYWVFENFYFLFDYIFKAKQYFAHNHTLATDPNLPPLSKNTDFCGYLFRFAFDELPPYFCEITLPYLRNIHFLKIIPLYKNEMQYVLEQEGKHDVKEEFINRFKKEQIPLRLDNNRKKLL